MRILLIAIATLLTLAYPLVVYFGIQRCSPALFSLFFIALAAIKLQVSQHQRDRSLVLTLTAIMAYSIALALSNSERLLLLYPAFVSFNVAAAFFASLRQDESLIERSARAHGKVITPAAKYYTRWLTAVWGCALLLNGGISLYLALLGARTAWALYSGLISYAWLAALFAGEYAYRRYYMAKHHA